MKTARGQYGASRRNARGRGIPFLLTYEEWLQIWLNSGHFAERGIGKGKYCMARFGDKGPYAVGNVKIILHVDNIREGHIGQKRSLETRAKIAAARRGNGHKHSAEAREKIRVALTGNTHTLGHTLSLEHRTNISQGLKGVQNTLGCKWTKETRTKMSIARKRWWNLRRAKEKEEVVR